VAAQSRKKALWLISISILIAVGALLYSFQLSRNQVAQAQPEPPAAPPGPLGVSSLGRIQPQDTPVIVGARSLSGQPSLVDRLNVREGDYIKAGQVIAILDSLPQLEAARLQAESRVALAEARIRQAMTGAKAADIAAHKTVIARLETELANAKSNLARTEGLFKSGVATRPALEQDELAVATITHRITEAKERLGSFEIRQVDVDVEVAALKAAEADVVRARAEADTATIRAPYDGVVLKVNAWQGQEIGPRGILELARVDNMYVIAEVAESDIRRVRIGQRATISGYSLPAPLEGEVERLGLKVSRNSLVQDNPINITDARVSEVRIRLQDGSSVRNLIDAQVEVVIHP
jgi:HlyD family secretion protein